MIFMGLNNPFHVLFVYFSLNQGSFFVALSYPHPLL